MRVKTNQFLSRPKLCPADKAIIALDIYEQWNLYPFNRQSLHVNATVAGNCSLAISHNALDPVMTNWNYTE